ncbi:MAG: hypothetical protein MK291_10535, partial [Planctomycetes bacterium]|nr:hypothetical protein [Planctomycetota bacterium]
MRLKANCRPREWALLALLAACSSEAPVPEPAAEGDEGLSTLRFSDAAQSPEEGLDAGAEGWDTELIGDVAKAHIKELLHHGLSPTAEDISQVTAATVSAGALRPKTRAVIREGEDFTVYRGTPAQSMEPGREALAASLRDLLSPFTEEPELHIKAWRVTETAEGAWVTLFYQAVGMNQEGRPYQQNATWECLIEPSQQLINGVRSTQHEEIVGPKGVETLFTDVTESALGHEEQLVLQLGPSLSDLASRTDVTVGAQIAEYEGVSVGDLNGDGLEDVYLTQTRGVPNRLLLQRPDGGRVPGRAPAEETHGREQAFPDSPSPVGHDR